MAGQQGQKIVGLKDALKKLSAAIKEVSKGLIDLEAVINRISGATNRLTQRQKELNSQMGKTSRGIKENTKAVKENDSATSKAEKSSRGFFATMGRNIATVARFYGAYMVLQGVMTAVSELTVGSARRAIQLDGALKRLSAVAGLTSDEVERLRKVVFDVAGVTSLTAMEVVELQKELAKLGATATEIENLTKPIALLAQTLGEDAGGVASALKKTINQFQATSEEADRFANVFTGAINETALTLTDLGTGLQYVGPLAKQLGLGVEETASLLGILADNGFRASRAGTGLRQFFVTAANDGRPFAEFLEDLAEKNINVAEATELFKRTGASQALVLLENVDRFRELTAELQDSNRLFRQNATAMSSVEGQLQILKSAYDALSISIGESLIQNRAFISLIGVISKEGASVAAGYVAISEATGEQKVAIDELVDSYSVLTEVSNPLKHQFDQVRLALDALGGYSGPQVQEFMVEFGKQMEKTGGDVQKALENMSPSSFDLYETVTERAAQAVRGLLIATEEQAESLDKTEIGIRANNEVVVSYTESLNELQSQLSKGNDIEEEKVELKRQLTEQIKAEQAALEALGDATDRRSQFDRDVIEKRISLLNELIKRINQTYKLEEEGSGVSKNQYQKEITAIRQRIKAEIDAINERAKQEDMAAESAEARADIERERRILVSEQYKEEARQIAELVKLYGEQEEAIRLASDASLANSEIRVSDVMKDASSALKDYLKSLEDLQQAKEEGTIGTDDYDRAVRELEVSFMSTLATLREMSSENENLLTLLDRLDDSWKAATIAANENEEASKKAIERVKEAFEEVANQAWEDIARQFTESVDEVLNEFNDTQLENTQNRLEAEIDAIRNRYEIEEEILRAQLQNQLITESQFRQKQIDLRRAQLAEENSINRKIFEAQQKQDVNDARIGGLTASAQAIINAFSTYKDPITAGIISTIMTGIIASGTAAKVSAINQRQFFPKKFEEGGMVDGPSHANGGVPFTVQGQGGYEMEGGEFIVNKRATSKYRDLLERINNSTISRRPAKMSFADGGLVTSATNQSVDYLKVIAEASMSTATNTSKPVRAFVTNRDLNSDSLERRIRDRNDRV